MAWHGPSRFCKERCSPVTPFTKRCLHVLLLTACLWLAAAPSPARTTGVAPLQDLLAQADKASTSDHQRYLELLAQLHGRESRMTPAQRQYLAFLDALGYDLQDQTGKAARMYRMILDHPVDKYIPMRAQVALVALDLRRRKYVEAYTRANALMEKLPRITDPRLRVASLNIILRVLFSEGQYAKAQGYAAQMVEQATDDADRCLAMVFLTESQLYQGNTLDATKADYQKTMDLCHAAGTPGVSNTLYPVWAGTMIDQGHPRQAIAYLKQHEPEILRSQFRLHIAIFHDVMARAHIKLGQYALARKSALAALAESPPGSYRWSRMTAYKRLYQVAKHDGDLATALSMHEKYMAQYQAHASDTEAQALAYQMVKQDMLTNKMDLRDLSKQNKILQLRQSLDRKSAETNRLYIMLLLLVLFSIGLWAYRTKHSQLRFRRMARHDDLTGIYSRQYFMEQAEQALHRLHKGASQGCMLIMDMDHFKRINDQYGHIHGDAVLRHVAHVCRSELRESDVFGRLGGEEFGILMPGCASAHGREIGERIRTALLERPVEISASESIMVTTSIGMACTGDYGYALKRLLSKADSALYEAKRGGRNRLVVSSGNAAVQAMA